MSLDGSTTRFLPRTVSVSRDSDTRRRPLPAGTSFAQSVRWEAGLWMLPFWSRVHPCRYRTPPYSGAVDRSPLSSRDRNMRGSARREVGSRRSHTRLRAPR